MTEHENRDTILILCAVAAFLVFLIALYISPWLLASVVSYSIGLILAFLARSPRAVAKNGDDISEAYNLLEPANLFLGVLGTIIPALFIFITAFYKPNIVFAVGLATIPMHILFQIKRLKILDAEKDAQRAERDHAFMSDINVQCCRLLVRYDPSAYPPPYERVVRSLISNHATALKTLITAVWGFQEPRSPYSSILSRNPSAAEFLRQIVDTKAPLPKHESWTYRDTEHHYFPVMLLFTYLYFFSHMSPQECEAVSPEQIATFQCFDSLISQHEPRFIAKLGEARENDLFVTIGINFDRLIREAREQLRSDQTVIGDRV